MTSPIGYGNSRQSVTSRWARTPKSLHPAKSSIPKFWFRACRRLLENLSTQRNAVKIPLSCLLNVSIGIRAPSGSDHTDGNAVYRAASATVIVSEDSSSEIVLRASGDVPLGPLPLADPKVGLSVSTSSGKVVHIVAQSDLTPLYSCLRVRDPIFGVPEVSPVRGPADTTASPLTRLAVEELLES